MEGERPIFIARAHGTSDDQSWNHMFPDLFRMMVDTGNSPHNIGGAHHNKQLENAQQSRAVFTGAFGNKLVKGELSGTLNMNILGATGESTTYKMNMTTIRTVQQDLMSFYALFKDGFNLVIDDVFPHMMHRVTGQIIPLFLDPVMGTWHVIYYLGDPVKAGHAFKQYVQWYIAHVHPKHMTVSRVSGIVNTLAATSQDEMTPIEKSIQPVLGNKGAIGPKFKKMTRAEVHGLHGHVDYLPAQCLTRDVRPPC